MLSEKVVLLSRSHDCRIQPRSPLQLLGITWWPKDKVKNQSNCCNRFYPLKKKHIPPWEMGKSSSNMPYQGDMLIPWRVPSQIYCYSKDFTLFFFTNCCKYDMSVTCDALPFRQFRKVPSSAPSKQKKTT